MKYKNVIPFRRSLSTCDECGGTLFVVESEVTFEDDSKKIIKQCSNCYADYKEELNDMLKMMNYI